MRSEGSCNKLQSDKAPQDDTNFLCGIKVIEYVARLSAVMIRYRVLSEHVIKNV